MKDKVIVGDELEEYFRDHSKINNDDIKDYV